MSPEQPNQEHETHEKAPEVQEELAKIEVLYEDAIPIYEHKIGSPEKKEKKEGEGITISLGDKKIWPREKSKE
jgi:hypothetical protein